MGEREMMSGETLKNLTNEDIESGVSSLEFDRQKADAEREDAGIAGESHGADKGDNEMISGETLKDLTDEDIESGVSSLEFDRQADEAQREDAKIEELRKKAEEEAA